MHCMNGDPLSVLNVLRSGFQWGRIDKAETADAGDLRPISEICDQLQATLASDRQSRSAYVDIAASKSEHALRAI
jgi:hypothetical protein